MPTHAAQLVAFLVVLAVSGLLHRFVYKNLKRVILRDYPKSGTRIAKSAKILFLVMDAPFLFLYFRSGMPEWLAHITTGLLYPFAVWQAVMLLWVVILIPVNLWQKSGAFGIKRLLAKRAGDREPEIEFEAQLEVVTE